MYLTSIIAVNNMTINKLNMTTNKIVCMIIILIIQPLLEFGYHFTSYDLHGAHEYY